MKKYSWIAGIALIVAIVGVSFFLTRAIANQDEGEPEKKEGKLIDEGSSLTCKGELTKVDDRPAFKITDGDHKDKTLTVLENSKLEELEKAIKEQKLTTVEVSVDVTKYNSKNFLVVTSFVNPKEKKEEKEKEEKEDKEEEEEEEEEEGEK